MKPLKNKSLLKMIGCFFIMFGVVGFDFDQIWIQANIKAAIMGIAGIALLIYSFYSKKEQTKKLS